MLGFLSMLRLSVHRLLPTGVWGVRGGCGAEDSARGPGIACSLQAPGARQRPSAGTRVGSNLLQGPVLHGSEGSRSTGEFLLRNVPRDTACRHFRSGHAEGAEDAVQSLDGKLFVRNFTAVHGMWCL